MAVRSKPFGLRTFALTGIRGGVIGKLLTEPCQVVHVRPKPTLVPDQAIYQVAEFFLGADAYCHNGRRRMATL